MRLVQLKAEDVRRLAVVDEPLLGLIQGFNSVYALAQEAIRSGKRVTTLIEDHLTKDTLDYEVSGSGSGRAGIFTSKLGEKNRCFRAVKAVVQP